ncbi:MAG: hypothetical protein IJ736_07210 [Firmicutes bacterium]|nr:hypothetical protein [Bacillota bacterium]
MSVKYKEIETEVGYIKPVRDAIYIDSFEQKHNSIIIKGEINSLFCSIKRDDHKWYRFELVMEQVSEYTAIDEEHFYAKTRIHTESDFSEYTDGSGNRVFILQTYDWSYIIKCREHKFKITGYR